MDTDRVDCGNELLLKDEVYRIVGAAFDVSNSLGCGFLESVYQEALEIEFRDKAIPFEAQKRIKILYKNNVLNKEFIADFVCYGGIIVEIKAIKRITEIEEVGQLQTLGVTRL